LVGGMAFYLFILFMAILLSVSRFDLCVRFSRHTSVDITPYFLLIIFLISVSSIRYGIGYDYFRYLSHVGDLAYLKGHSYESINTLIFFVANKLNQPQLVFIIYAIVTGWFIYRGCKENSLNIGLSLLIYVCLFYTESFSTIRQWAAAAIIFWGFRYIKNKKFIKYIICCLVATLIHQYAFLSIVIYFFYYANTITSTIIVLLIALLARPIVSILAPYFVSFLALKSHLDNAGTSGNFWMVFFLLIALFNTITFVIYYRYNLNSMNLEELGLFNIGFVGAIIPLVFGSGNGHRLSYFFNIFLMILLPHSISKYKNQWLLLMIWIIALSAVYILYLLVTKTQGNAYVPFVTIFNR